MGVIGGNLTHCSHVGDLKCVVPWMVPKILLTCTLCSFRFHILSSIVLEAFGITEMVNTVHRQKKSWRTSPSEGTKSLSDSHKMAYTEHHPYIWYAISYYLLLSKKNVRKCLKDTCNREIMARWHL